LSGDHSACGAESAFTIGELDFGGLVALLKLAYCPAQFDDLCAGCEWHHDQITSLLFRGLLGRALIGRSSYRVPVDS
jgi:hypothetical protein